MKTLTRWPERQSAHFVIDYHLNVVLNIGIVAMDTQSLLYLELWISDVHVYYFTGHLPTANQSETTTVCWPWNKAGNRRGDLSLGEEFMSMWSVCKCKSFDHWVIRAVWLGREECVWVSWCINTTPCPRLDHNGAAAARCLTAAASLKVGKHEQHRFQSYSAKRSQE